MPSTHRPRPPEVPLGIWRDLLAAAKAVRETEPWQWLADRDVFALIDEDGQAWFPSVLGAAGQVFGVALYRGENGLRFFFETVETLGENPRDALFRQDALLLDWGAKKALAPEDLAVLAALGHAPRPREKHAWPSFRSHAPGWHPWFLDAGEARALARGARAALACAELARQDEDFFAPCDEDGRVLPTVELAAALAGPLTPAQVEWRTWQLAPPPPPGAPVAPPEWQAVAALPQDPQAVLEFDVFHLASPVSDGGRPYFPRLSLLADGQSGFIYASDMAPPARAWADVVLATWSQAWRAIRVRPGAIAIGRPEWEIPLTALAAPLGIAIEVRDALPFIDEARASFEMFQRR